MPSEFTAPQVREHARDMLLSMGELLARGASVKSKINAISLATRLNAGRVKRYFYQEVERVPADEYLTIQSWHDKLRLKLGDLEKQYSAARTALLEQSAGDPVVARVAPPDIEPPPAREVKINPDLERRLIRAFEPQLRRIMPWVR